MLEIILLSAIQGITEFLPISSTAHLIFLSEFLSIKNENLTTDISLHLGSLLAVLFFFKIEIFNYLTNKFLFLKIVIGSLPTLFFGFILVKFNLIEEIRNIYIISLTTILFGIVLFISDRSIIKKNTINDLSIKDAIYIGFLQPLSLIPGVSRSGITITGARFLKFNRVVSAKISFLFSIPTLLAVSSYGILSILEKKNLEITIHNFWAVIFSFLFSYIALKYFITFLQKYSLMFFVIYRVILGIVILTYINA